MRKLGVQTLPPAPVDQRINHYSPLNCVTKHAFHEKAGSLKCQKSYEFSRLESRNNADGKVFLGVDTDLYH